jgi:hypothetical protein
MIKIVFGVVESNSDCVMIFPLQDSIGLLNLVKQDILKNDVPYEVVGNSAHTFYCVGDFYVFSKIKIVYGGKSQRISYRAFIVALEKHETDYNVLEELDKLENQHTAGETIQQDRLPDIIKSDISHSKNTIIAVYYNGEEELEKYFIIDDNYKQYNRIYFIDKNSKGKSDPIKALKNYDVVVDINKLISVTERVQEDTEKSKKQILKNIKDDLNYYLVYIVKTFLENGTITDTELLKAVEGDSELVEAIKSCKQPKLEEDNSKVITPERINDYCTEIYFWGLPEAGKTWALAGIFNTINSEGYFRPHKNQKVIINEEYLNGLLGLIHNGKPINILPEKTSNATIRYMNFKLLNNSEERKVAFIDLSGEIVKAIATKKHTGLVNEINLLESLLINKNRKIHFFFIDYTREDDNDKNGQQNIHFTNLCTVFDSKKYFEKNTDFIYIVITKADMIDENENLRRNKAIKFFNENYKSFKNNIGKICQDNEINFGDEKKKGDYSFLDEYTLVFSIGEVLFKRMCRFNNKSSLKIVDIIQKNVPKEGSGRTWIFG